MQQCSLWFSESLKQGFHIVEILHPAINLLKQDLKWHSGNVKTLILIMVQPYKWDELLKGNWELATGNVGRQEAGM